MAGTVALWRFDERKDLDRPQEVLGNVAELDIEGALGRAPVVDAALGRGRRYLPGSSRGWRAQDLVSGSTLLQRDMSVQFVAWWNLAGQNAYGQAGAIYTRGRGTSTGERVSAGIELRVVNAAAGVGEIRWLWQDSGGTERVQVGGHFVPHATAYMLLTATRRWVSPTSAILRYYCGGDLLTEIETANGDIPGGTLGTTLIGTRYTGGAFARFFDGVIDQLRVVDYELAKEEIAATWKRISVHQPRGYALFRELHDPGFPISQDPSSRVQKETRWAGHGLGLAASLGHNFADNALPDRAYGGLLTEWEDAAKPVPSPRQGDSLDTRRARVLARLRSKLGVSIPGIKEAIRELVGTHPDNLEILAFDQTIVEDHATLNPLRWLYEPAAQWSIVGGKLQVAAAAASIPFAGLEGLSWYTSRMALGGNGRNATLITHVDLATFAANGHAGVWFGDLARGNVALFGVRYTSAGNVIPYYELFTAWVSSGITDLAGATAFTSGWLRISHDDGAGLAFPRFRFALSTVAEGGPYGVTGVVAVPAAWTYGVQWAGHFLRTAGGAATLNVKFDDTKIRTPYGARPFRVYVYRNPALPGVPDYDAVNGILRRLKQSHTSATVITTKVAICDDPSSRCDLTPMGAI